MKTLPELRGALPGVDWQGEKSARGHPDPAPGARDAPTRPLRPWRRALKGSVRYPLAVYALSRAVYLIIALADGASQNWSLGHELRNWDGKWYRALAEHGYPTFVAHHQSTLGFFPLYSMAMWLVAHLLFCGYVAAGLIISLITGAVATVLISQLSTRWFGDAASRRGVLFFCLFPGSIVFSMVYTEGLMLALIAGSLLALEQRQWRRAGVLAGIATAVGPVALAIIPAAGAVAVREIRSRGWANADARRSLQAPILACGGIALFGLFLWVWTGTPFASFNAQHDEWQEHSSPIALYYTAHHLLRAVVRFHSLHHPGINLNLVAGLVGAAFLFYALWRMWHARAEMPLGAIVWTLGVTLLTVTSEQAPPNPRLLICAFPALLAVAKDARGPSFRRLIVTSSLLLLVMSWVSFVGNGLRP